MSISYSYDEPVGGATIIQVVYDDGTQTKVLELEAVFTEGEYDAILTEELVAGEIANLSFP